MNDGILVLCAVAGVLVAGLGALWLWERRRSWLLAPLPRGGDPVQVRVWTFLNGPETWVFAWDAGAEAWVEPVHGLTLPADTRPRKWRRCKRGA